MGALQRTRNPRSPLALPPETTEKGLRAVMDKFALDKLRNAVDDACVARVAVAAAAKYGEGLLTRRSALLRSKNAVKAKMGTDIERKMEEALSNKNWGASSTLLNEISQLTYD